MRNQKVLQNNQINWFDEGSTRLNYQMIFNENNTLEETDEYPEESADVNELLDERDAKWRRKIEQVRAEAYAEGFDTGRAEGVEEARSEFDVKFAAIREALDAAQLEWQKRQESLEPGLMDLVFEISEAILGIPVENPAIRKTLDEKVGSLLQKMDEQSKPVLNVSESDMEWAKELKEDFSKSLTLNIQTSEECLPGEFILESNEETLVHSFQGLLQDFRKELALPSWK